MGEESLGFLRSTNKDNFRDNFIRQDDSCGAVDMTESRIVKRLKKGMRART
jgi:hypothetical protein